MRVRSCAYGSLALGVACLVTSCATTAPQIPEAAPPVSAQQQTAAEQAAQSAALAWFELLDAEKYTESWAAASTPFRQYSWSQSRWRSMIKWGRVRLGPLHSRRLQSAVFVQTVPEHTAEGRWLAGRRGEYVIVGFASSYGHFNVTETVIVMKDSDGVWRVADYYIASGDAQACTGSRMCE